METTTLSPLKEMTVKFPTQLWNDSCSTSELQYAMEHGAVGATSNPVIVSQVLDRERSAWMPVIERLVSEYCTASEDTVGWKLVEAMAVVGAAMLEPIFRESGGAFGRLSVQTNPKLYRDSDAMVTQALELAALAPNMQIKVPTTIAGLEAMAELTYRGISINATVCFTVAQSLAVADVVERALIRRSSENKSNDAITPVCTIMVGRLDDWLKEVAARDHVIVDPECFEWAGVAAMKHAYELYGQRRYRTRLLAAAYRNHLHWSQFIGGNVILTIPYVWQKRFNGSDIPIVDRMSDPVSPSIITFLLDKFPDFAAAYEVDGLSPAGFDTYGATVKTLRSFISGYTGLIDSIRDTMLPTA